MDPEINEKCKEIRASLPRDFKKGDGMNIVEQLRAHKRIYDEDLYTNAADTIEQQAARISRLEGDVEALAEALRKIAAIENQYDCGDWDEIEAARNIARITLRRVEEKV